MQIKMETKWVVYPGEMGIWDAIVCDNYNVAKQVKAQKLIEAKKEAEKWIEEELADNRENGVECNLSLIAEIHDALLEDSSTVYIRDKNARYGYISEWRKITIRKIQYAYQDKDS